MIVAEVGRCWWLNRTVHVSYTWHIVQVLTAVQMGHLTAIMLVHVVPLVRAVVTHVIPTCCA